MKHTLRTTFFFNNKVYLFPFGFYNEMHLIIRLKPDSAYMLDMYSCWVGPSLRTLRTTCVGKHKLNTEDNMPLERNMK